jgi:hypothetical protein
MAPLSRMHGTSGAGSTPRDLSTGASWARTAPPFKQPGPPPVGRTIVKRGPNQARRRNRTCPWLWTCRSCEAGSPPLVHLPQDRQGLPLGAVLSAGQRRRSAFFADLTGEVLVPQPRGRPRKRPEAIAGDRAYDADWIRQWHTDSSGTRTKASSQRSRRAKYARRPQAPTNLR